MAHECPDCGQVCHCSGDIDDCVFNVDSYVEACVHCMGVDEPPDDGDDCGQCGTCAECAEATREYVEGVGMNAVKRYTLDTTIGILREAEDGWLVRLEDVQHLLDRNRDLEDDAAKWKLFMHHVAQAAGVTGVMEHDAGGIVYAVRRLAEDSLRLRKFEEAYE
jgi:hypothetical protein